LPFLLLAYIYHPLPVAKALRFTVQFLAVECFLFPHKLPCVVFFGVSSSLSLYSIFTFTSLNHESLVIIFFITCSLVMR